MTRKNNISLLRLFCTLSVLIFHLFFVFAPNNINFNYAYFAYGVQVLCFASGLLYSQKQITDVKEFYKKSILKLIIPCLIFIIFIFSLDAIILFIQNNFTWNNFVNSCLGYRVSNNGLLMQVANLWFIPVFLICYLLLPLFQKITEKNNASLILFPIIVITEMLLCTPPVIYPFIFGYLIGKVRFNKIVDAQPKKFLQVTFNFIFVILCVVGVIIIQNVPSKNAFFSFLKSFFSSFFQGTISVFIANTFLIMFQFINRFNFFNKFFSYADKLCLNIYIANQAFMIGIINLWGLTNNIFIDALIIIFETILSAVIVTYISSKILNKVNKTPKIT